MSTTVPPATSATPSIFASKLSPTLVAHLSSIPIDTLSRTAPARLKETALPNIGLIELVESTDFASLYDALYVSMFPRRTERERSDLIVERLAAQARGERRGLAPYRVVGIRDPNGEVVGAAQFSVLPLPVGSAAEDHGEGHSKGNGDDQDQGLESRSNSDPASGGSASASASRFAVPYLQYIYVRPQNRRQDMSEVLHTMVLAVAAADAAGMDDGVGRTVPFTLFETEPPDHGDDVASRAYAHERSKIHTSTGGVALVLRRLRDGKILSAHVQPGLEEGDPPLTLVWVIRQSPNPGQPYEIKTVGRLLLAAYYQSLRDEGFPDQNIRRAEMMVAERCRGSVFYSMPLSDVRDFTDPDHLDTYRHD